MRYAIILASLVWFMPEAVRSEIIYFRPDEPLFSGWGLDYPPDRPDDSLDVDLNFDGILDINFKGKVRSEFLSFTYGNTWVLGRPSPPAFPDSGVYQIPLKPGDFIGEDASIDWWPSTDVGWGTGSQGNLFNSYMSVGGQLMGIGFWQDIPPLSADGYLGVQFEIEGGIHYAWVHIRAGGNHGFIDEWAYESTPGTGIVAGAIPEPSTLALLLAGAAGIWTVRKRKFRAQEIRILGGCSDPWSVHKQADDWGEDTL